MKVFGWPPCSTAVNLWNSRQSPRELGFQIYPGNAVCRSVGTRCNWNCRGYYLFLVTMRHRGNEPKSAVWNLWRAHQDTTFDNSVLWHYSESGHRYFQRCMKLVTVSTFGSSTEATRNPLCSSLLKFARCSSGSRLQIVYVLDLYWLELANLTIKLLYVCGLFFHIS